MVLWEGPCFCELRHIGFLPLLGRGRYSRLHVGSAEGYLHCVERKHTVWMCTVLILHQWLHEFQRSDSICLLWCWLLGLVISSAEPWGPGGQLG